MTPALQSLREVPIAAQIEAIDHVIIFLQCFEGDGYSDEIRTHLLAAQQTLRTLAASAGRSGGGG